MIISDNASEDATAEIARAYQPATPGCATTATTGTWA